MRTLARTPPRPAALLPAAIKVQFTEAEPIVRCDVMMSMVCIGCKTKIHFRIISISTEPL